MAPINVFALTKWRNYFSSKCTETILWKSPIYANSSFQRAYFDNFSFLVRLIVFMALALWRRDGHRKFVTCYGVIRRV